MKKDNKGAVSLEYILAIILVVIVCLFAFRFFGRTLSNTIDNSSNAVRTSTETIISSVPTGSGSGNGGSGSGSGGSGGSLAHTHNHNVLVGITPSTCEGQGQIQVKCSCGEDLQTYNLPKATSCDIENVLVVDSDLGTVNLDQSTKVQVKGNYSITSLTGSGDLCFEFDDPNYTLTVGEAEITSIPKGYGISTKFYNGSTPEVPMFDPYDGWLDSNYDLASNIEISQIGATFSNLYGTGTLSRDSGGSYNVVSGLVKNPGINEITYNGDWTYSVSANKSASSVEIELVFDYAEKGNGLEYYVQSSVPNLEINSKVTVSDYNTNAYTSYVIRFMPDGSETTSTLFVFNPNNPLNDYRVINIVFE